MDTNLLLIVKCITLLYRESLISSKTDNSADLVRTVLGEIKNPEATVTINKEALVIEALRETALDMCNNDYTETYEKDELLQTLKLNCKDDETTYEALVGGIDNQMDEGSLKRTTLSIQKSLRNKFRDDKVIDIIHKAGLEVKFRKKNIKSIPNFIKDLCVKLEPYQTDINTADPAVISSVDIGDTAKMTEVFTEVQDTASSKNILTTGWKGFNRLTNGGLRRGELVTIAALPHNNKTGFSLSLFRQIALYNKPCMKDPSKKPLLLRISFEDNILLNSEFLYRLCYENITKEKANLKNITPSEISEYVKDKMQINGYHIKLMRVNPSDWTYKDIQNTILAAESEGYEVHVLEVDYLTMLPTTGCEDGPMGHAVRDMYKRMRNFCSA